MPDETTPDVAVKDVPDESRYEARLDGIDAVAAAYYRLRGDTLVFTHTEVPDAFQGRGVGSTLARYALDDARRRGLHVVPRCSFIKGYIERHAEYRDLVVQG